MHAVGTVDVVGQHLDNTLVLALAHDSMTEKRVTPWYRNTVELDRRRIALYNAFLEGRPEPQPADAQADRSLELCPLLRPARRKQHRDQF
jgi:hypothetical protein